MGWSSSQSVRVLLTVFAVVFFALGFFALSSVTPDAAFANFNNYGSNDCTSCHSEPSANSTIYASAYNITQTGSRYENSGAGLANVVVGPIAADAGDSVEIDFYFNNLTNSSNEQNGVMLRLPTSWTGATVVTDGTSSSPSFGGWDTSWDTTSTDAAWSQLFSSTFMWGVDFDASSFDTNNSKAGSTPACNDGDLLVGGGDKCLDTDGNTNGYEMGTDLTLAIPSGATTGTYDVIVYGIGHDGTTGNQAYASAIIRLNVTGAANTAPTITSDGGGATASVNAAENQTSVTDVQSTDDSDSEGSGLTYSITGGTDQSAFSIVASTGVLTFNSAPDYESPTDTGANNVYDVQVTVTDSGALTDVQDIAVTVTNVNEAPTITSSATPSASENQTSVIDVQSTDPEGETEGAGLSYSITGGADSGAFSIVASTGVLTFNSAPDFESPTDTGANNVYDVQVTVTDGGALTDVQAIAVTVTNVNEAPTITSSATPSAAENQTSVIDVQSTDPEGETEGSGLTYSITGGADSGAFSIVASTGVLTFNSAPDYESPTDTGGDNVYDVQVTVTDSGALTDVQAIAVTVTDANDAPTITSSATPSAAENQTSVIDVQSTDPDGETEGAGLSYSITGGADSGAFSIVASTGVLTFNSAPDYESPTDTGGDNVYDVQVTVTDSGALTDVQAIAVTVTDANDAPTITSSATPSAAENQTSVIDVQSTDPEGDIEGAGLSYSITGGADSGAFSIVASTGVLTFNSAPDFENPTDSGANNVYDVQVTVTDSGALTDVQAIAVTVTDVNEAPAITSDGGGATASVNADENQTSVTDVNASDDSDSEGSGLTYSITGGADSGAFSIVASTGVLTFNSAPDFENPTDSGANNVYDVQVTVTDSGALTDVQDIAVTVNDTAENVAPTITSSATPSAAENQTSAIDVQSTDDSDSEGSGLTYSITGGADSGAFSIVASTGVLTFNSTPDYESPTDSGANNVYDVQVTVTDSGALTDVQDIAVTVTDVNENPNITSNGGGDLANINAAENQTSVTDVQSSDPEGDAEGSGLTYSITGGTDSAEFSIVSGTGVLTFKSAPDYESPGDSNADNVYQVIVRVTDSGALYDQQTINVTVTNVNESPNITSDGGGATASVNADENQTSVTDVNASDDSDSEGSGLTYSITGGADSGAFSIVASTGVLTFNSAPDYESPTDSGGDNVYDVQVTVTDSGALTDVQDIAVTVNDVADGAPVITSDGGGATASVNAAENQTSVTDVQSTDDADSEGSGLTYSLTGGADQAKFSIVASTGVLTFISAPDYESPTDSGADGVYDVQVTVTDSGALTDVQDIAVTVTNVNEAPSITSDGGGATASVNAAENQTSVTDVQSTDPEGETEGAGLSYSITGGADQAKFSIVASTGVLTFVSPPNYESPTDSGADGVYDVQVTVTDGGALTDVQDIAVTVTNANDNPNITSDGGGDLANLNAAENQTSVTDVQSADVDGDTEGSGLTYSISGGTDSGKFSIVASTGVLTFTSAPDYETPGDSNADNVYQVVVRVTDSGALYDQQTINVTVTDVNEAPTITSDGGGATASVNADENQTSVTDVQSTDPDGETEGSGLSYSITGGADQSAFSIVASTGVLTFNSAPDYENPTDSGTDNVYDVQVTVTDGGALTDVQDIAVTVNDVADGAPVITSDGGGATASVNAAENQTSVTDVQSTDDVDSEGSGLSYSITGGADQSAFSIVASTGVLTFNSAPDYENPTDSGTNGVYDVQVTVTDSGALTDVQDIAVTVTDVNEAPTITSDGGGASASVNADENQTSVTDVQSTDPDGETEGSGLSYSITGGADQSAFSIVASTGVLTFNSAPDYENPTDSGTDNVYDVQVTVTDGGALTDVQDITVTVNDIAENGAPTITSSATPSAAENQTSVIDVESTDDSDSEGSGLTYSITGGADQAKFSIVASTGVLTFQSAPDYEDPTDSGTDNVYNVQVTVTDSGALTDVQDIAVTVTDVNEAPSITSSATVNVAENQTSVTDVQATDDSDSEGSGLTYSISGGADQAKFSIVASTGVLTFQSAPDFENPTDSGTDNVYDVQVTVTDGGALTDVQDIAVTVTDVAVETAPGEPSGINIIGMRDNGPRIQWSSVADATQYNIYRSTDGSTWGSAIGSVSDPTTTYWDTSSPKSNTVYYWTVTAENGMGESTKPAGVSDRTALMEGWNLVSAPMNTSGTAIEEFGAWANWAWFWEPGPPTGDPDNDGAWTQSFNVLPGYATLVWAYNNTTVLTASGTDGSGFVDVLLKPGWNLVSNHTPTAMTNISGTWLVDGNPIGDAISGGTIGNSLYWWNGSNYDSYNIGSNPTVEPWKGYWILNQDTGDHTLRIQ